MGKVILTSRGLNTKIGKKIIFKVVAEEDKRNKNILLITLAEYGINDLLMNAAMEMGFDKNNIFIIDGTNHIDLSKKYHYIYVSEGNTFELLNKMRKPGGLTERIIELMKEGATYIGASAGAMIASTDITLAADFDRNFVRMTDFKGLGLIDGTIIPHYTKKEFARYLKNTPAHLKKRYNNIYYVSNNGVFIKDYI